MSDLAHKPPSRDSVNIRGLTSIWDKVIELSDKLPGVNDFSDQPKYREVIREIFVATTEELLSSQSATTFDLVGIEYKSLWRRFLPGGFGEEPWIFYAGDRKDEERPKTVYEESFPFLELLPKNWLHVWFAGKEKSFPTVGGSHVIQIGYPFTADPEGKLSDEGDPKALGRYLTEATEDLKAFSQGSFYDNSDEEIKRRRKVVRESSAITMTILRETGTSRSILFVPTYVGASVRIGGMVFMGESSLTEDQCHFFEIGAKVILSTVRLIEEAKTQGNLRADREKEVLRGFLLQRMSHDIRHPFIESLNFLKNLEEKTLTIANAVEAIHSLGRQTGTLVGDLERIMGIINDTLFALETGVFDQVPLKRREDAVGDFLEDFQWLFRESLTEERALRIKVPEAEFKFTFDAAIIREVLSNLVRNSIAYSTGDITIEAYLKDSQCLILQISDVGPGVSDEVRKTLWQFSAQKVVPSTAESGRQGRGLAISKRLMEIHGTDLECAAPDEYSLGARFRLIIGTPMAKKEIEE